jgi:hypothetical protein
MQREMFLNRADKHGCIMHLVELQHCNTSRSSAMPVLPLRLFMI